ncbi:MAG: ribbon-helix-helix protein, CopG family [Candidatus Rokubacteria bacterium]|nr:ribbon-helix-helix protein, CopG family [Candidatus Rokubacteria bacterium]
MTGYARVVKIAISIPDNLFREVEACTRRLNVSRSRLFTEAAREYLARRRDPIDATRAWNDAIAVSGQPGNAPGPVALRRRGKAMVRMTSIRRR